MFTPVQIHHSAPSILRRGLWLSMFALLAVMWGLVLVFSGMYRDRLLSDATRELEQLNSVVTQHTLALLKSVETDLRVVDLWLQAHVNSDPLTDPAFLALLEELRRLSGDLIDLRLLSSDGTVHPGADAAGSGPVNVSDRDYFKAQLGHGERRLYIGSPVVRRTTGTWGIPISWRLENERAGLKMVVAVVELDRLIKPHEQWRLKEWGGLLLVRADGRLLSRAPMDPAMLGKDVSGSPNFPRFHTAERGHFESDGRFSDGVRRIVSFEHLPDKSLFVVATRGFDEALEPYFATRRLVFTVAGVLSVLALAFAGFMHRIQRSLFKAQHHIQRLAMEDELTGVMNRRAFFLQAGREFARVSRAKGRLSLLMMDIDHFKQINDRHGHAVGDEVLAALPALWAQALRRGDLLGRLGGEEFGVLLPDTGPEGAAEIAERLRALSARSRPSSRVAALEVTISIGVASSTPADADWQAILARADAALYRAKATGRNRVEA
ncbi:GGDEF domain-containing protein [Uliginosibacterium aquaticum]|uniref:diguanylate cyclase n=1 Tax=Uliginosibacterium aquaticum TaxID=2731212 RepID=A0ABX2IH53_9RHOO|nr:sensor domain-containing diguanylate cyclase [Uliginosibacterium aquaticum]NSL53415.1 GGDEF domain-containing protein [Uliginosibacterium aquaticum]